MKIPNIIMLGTFWLLAGCGTPPYLATTPGHALPRGIAVCTENDSLGRCKTWSPASDTCINPLGIDANPPTMPCADIAKVAQ